MNKIKINRCRKTDKYLSIGRGGEIEMVDSPRSAGSIGATPTGTGSASAFYLEEYGEDTFSLKTIFGTYLSISPDGSSVCMSQVLCVVLLHVGCCVALRCGFCVTLCCCVALLGWVVLCCVALRYVELRCLALR